MRRSLARTTLTWPEPLTGLASVDRDRGKYAEAEAHYKRAPGDL
jgi:hypothetical protein